MISTRSRYGLRALIDLIIHYKGKPVMLKDIASREGISERYLENIFTRLRTAGILKSSKGRKGGFYPARSAGDIRLLDIVETLEKDTAFSSCVDEPSACSRSRSCISREAWTTVNRSFRQSLEAVSLADLIKDSEKSPAKRVNFSGEDLRSDV
jgi:Rrf2 family cysteine metabolism transcriptional repressor